MAFHANSGAGRAAGGGRDPEPSRHLDQTLDRLLIIGAAIFTPALILSIARAAYLEWHPVFSVSIVLVAGLWIVVGLRRRISFGWRATIALGTLWLNLVVGLWPNEEAIAERLSSVPAEERAAARQKLFEESVGRANRELASFESLKKHVVFDTPLTVESELLTPSLKIRRKKIYERFKPEFEALYAEGRKP